ncbi:MAG: glycosyltransferase, partial [Woeseia sp.]
RSGALTVAEVAAAGLGAVFVPYPAAVDDHQTVNASGLVAAGAACILQERDLDAPKLAATLREWLTDRDGLRDRAERARKLAAPDALSTITGVCLELAGGAA